MPFFEIETYRVSSYIERFTTGTRRTRSLEMTGPVLNNGLQNRASFGFDSFVGDVWNNPSAGYLADFDSGLWVVGWYPFSEFPHCYDILRSERPVYVFYYLRDAGANSGYLMKVGFGTSFEEIGEGPSDSEEAISEIMAARLRAIRSPLVPMPTREDLPDQGGED